MSFKLQKGLFQFFFFFWAFILWKYFTVNLNYTSFSNVNEVHVVFHLIVICCLFQTTVRIMGKADKKTKTLVRRGKETPSEIPRSRRERWLKRVTYSKAKRRGKAFLPIAMERHLQLEKVSSLYIYIYIHSFAISLRNIKLSMWIFVLC